MIVALATFRKITESRGWALLAVLVDSDLFVLGTKEFGTVTWLKEVPHPFQNLCPAAELDSLHA